MKALQMSKISNLPQHIIVWNNTLEVVFHSAIELVSYLESERPTNVT